MIKMTKSAAKSGMHVIDMDFEINMIRYDANNAFFDLKKVGVMKTGLGTDYKKNSLDVLNIDSFVINQLMNVKFIHTKTADGHGGGIIGAVKMRVTSKCELEDEKYQISWDLWQADLEKSMKFTNQTLSFPAGMQSQFDIKAPISMTATLLEEIAEESDDQTSLDDFTEN